jgi:outer membrane putative beta-barrel porin/alpha-amylase
MSKIRLLALALLCAPCICAACIAAGADEKSRFHLLDPTPPPLMRPMSTDRPDKTESPYTVDAGHVQVEMDIVSYFYDRRNPEHQARRVQGASFFATNWKVGLLNNLDVQLVSEPFVWLRQEDLNAGLDDDDVGSGDATLRAKLNLWGNDGGKTALAVMPFITFDTSDEELGTTGTEFGLIIPLAIELPHEFGLGLMSEFDFVRDDSNDLNFVWVNTATLGRDIVKNLGGYIELFTAVDPDRTSAWEATLDFGLTYAISPDIQLDGGINIGLTREADDWSPFVGISIRY